MYFQQFYLSCLAHASYLLGSEGVAAVVGPQRDVEIYLQDAQKQGLRPLHELRESLADLDQRKPVAAQCKSGYRSSIGASILKAAGFKDVMNVVGGFDAWQAYNLPRAAGEVRKTRVPDPGLS